MSRTYLYERQTEYWTSRQIEDFFLDRGFEIVTLPISPNVEKLIPADFIFSATSFIKIFGLQYKALYRNGEDHWHLNSAQHDQLQKYPWVYYCLSEMKDASFYRSALHYCRFIDPTFTFQPLLYLTGKQRMSGYRKWASFYNSLAACERGARVTDKNHLKSLLQAGQDDPQLRRLTGVATSLFLFDLNNKQMRHFSSLFNPVQNIEENNLQ